MSAIQAPAPDAIAFQLVATLDQYEADTAAMIAGWPDLDQYGAVTSHVEKIRRYSAALPELRVEWVELLIAHAELVHHLWRVQHAPEDAVRQAVQPLRAQHAGAIVGLRKRCLRRMTHA
jgi:hypothetical protein